MTVTVNDVIDGHVVLDLECPDRIYFYLCLRHEVARCEWLREGGRLMPET
jgi:hypothetical protein